MSRPWRRLRSSPPLLAIAGVLAVVLAGSRVPLRAQSDLDALMREVIEARDENWTRLQQYVLDEQEQFTIKGPGGGVLWGERRDYTWYIRDSLFVRSPLRVNGAPVGDADRQRYEQQFIREELERERRRRERDGAASSTANSAGNNATASGPESGGASAPRPGVELPPPDPRPPGTAAPSAPAPSAAAPSGDSADPGDDVASLMKQGRQPQFISSAYFLRFRFESGKYALVGREPVEGQNALRIEYYPSALFREPQRPGAEKRANDPVNRETRRLMNKVSIVTLWVDPAQKQILKYTFDNVSLDFLPTQWFTRVTDVKATMTMGQAFPGVWLPKRIDATVAGTLAVGQWEMQYATQYLDYRRADVGTKVLVPR